MIGGGVYTIRFVIEATVTAYLVPKQERNCLFWGEKMLSDMMLLSPTIEVKGRNEKPIFSLKRKGEKYGQLYYIFKTYEENCQPDELEKIKEVIRLMKDAAAITELPLYNIDEIAQSVNEVVKKNPELSGDITIEVFNHATGEMHDLILGITKRRRESAY